MWLFEIIDENSFFKIKELDENTIDFGILTTALTYGNIAKFLQLPERVTPDLKGLNVDHLRKFTMWLFERDDEGQTRLGDSRNLKNLNAVLGNEGAQEAFLAGKSLDDALRLTEQPGQIFRGALINARSALRLARDYMHFVRKPTIEFELLDEIELITEGVRGALKAYAEKGRPEVTAKTKEVTTLERLPGVGMRHSSPTPHLLCLFNIDREMTKDVLVDRFKEGRDTGSKLEEEAEDDEAPDEELKEESSASDEQLSEKAEELFRHLKYREGAFGRKYPFAVDMTHRRLTLRGTAGARRLYIFLLLAANLRYFKSLTHRLTTDFEAISKVALERILPASAKVYFFHGAGRSGRYKGKLFEKMKFLAGDIFEKMSVEADDFDEHDVGDGGLDLVGWVPTGDSSPGILICFGQCACTDKWVKKQREPLAVDQVMSLKAAPAKITFIPFCFRRPTGGWFYSHSVETVVIDRLRLMTTLTDSRRYSKLASFEKLSELVKGAEPVI